MSYCLSLRGVSKSYEAGVRGCSAAVRVLRDVDLDVRAGEIVGISAAPSAGKTTLLMCAAGLIRPDRGTISWFGSTPKRERDARPEGIAYASDRPFPYGFLSARESLEYAAVVRDLPLRDSASRVTGVLERTGLDAVAHRRVDALDGSQLSRLAMAGVLLARPRLILVDDLASGGDADTGHTLTHLLCAAAVDGTGVVLAGRLMAWLSSDSPRPRVPIRMVSLVGGRIEPTSDQPVGPARRSGMTVMPARVAEFARPATAQENEAR